MYDKLKPCTKKGNFHARALDLEGDGQTLMEHLLSPRLKIMTALNYDA